ncbi:MAG: RidA family protein [Myxococcales bacterium]|nr:RidA family protein [Myxococcales bacterium]
MSQRSVAERLAEAGLTLPPVAAPVASYVPALVSGPWVFVSGQLPFEGGELKRKGKVGGAVAPEEAKRLAQVAGLNAVAAAASVVGGLGGLKGVVKVTGFVASAPGFNGQPSVVNGASDLFQRLFGDSGRHARSAVGVSELPLDAPVEVEVIFERA